MVFKMENAAHESTSAVDTYTCTGHSRLSCRSSSYANRNLSRSTSMAPWDTVCRPRDLDSDQRLSSPPRDEESSDGYLNSTLVSASKNGTFTRVASLAS